MRALAILSLLVVLAFAVRVDSSRMITVGGKSGEFAKIQDAIDAIPANNAGGRVVINVTSGIYREKVVINKPNITLIGRGARSTIITWNEPWKHFDSPTVSVLASDFVAKGLTFQNTFGTGGPAVTMRVAADRVAFYHCSFLSYQDTLLDDEAGRHYYQGCCYVEGGTDFICGNGKALFEKCHLHSMSMAGGAFTAQRRMAQSEDTGYSFVRCRLTSVGVGKSILGLPWAPYSRVVFAQSSISNTVRSDGWEDWGRPERQSTAFYGEFNCYGNGSDTARRVPWSHKLSPGEAAPFLTKAWLDGKDWLEGN